MKPQTILLLIVLLSLVRGQSEGSSGGSSEGSSGGDDGILGAIIYEIVGAIISAIFLVMIKVVFGVIGAGIYVMFPATFSDPWWLIDWVIQKKQFFINTLLYFLCAVYLFCLAVQKIQNRKCRKRLSDQFIRKHNQRVRDYEVSQEELSSRFQSLARLPTQISFIQDKKESLTASFRINGSRAAQKCLYNIKFESSDDLGKWKAFGLLGFSREEVHIFFEKVYTDRNKAKQWALLFFYGSRSSVGSCFQGTWQFEVHKKRKDDPEFRGEWKSLAKEPIGSLKAEKKKQTKKLT